MRGRGGRREGEWRERKREGNAQKQKPDQNSYQFINSKKKKKKGRKGGKKIVK